MSLTRAQTIWEDCGTVIDPHNRTITIAEIDFATQKLMEEFSKHVYQFGLEAAKRNFGIDEFNKHNFRFGV